MISSSADALSHPAHKFVNNTFAHPPWNICYEVFDRLLKFCHILWVIVVDTIFAVSPQKEVKWTKV